MKCILILPLVPAALALASCGDSPETSLAKAQKEFAAHDFATARVHLVAALSGKPGDKTALLLQARTLIALGDGEGARAVIEQLAGKAPPPGELSELAAEAALLRNQPDAVATFVAATQSVEAERLRAVALLQKGNVGGAASHFESGLAAGGSGRLFADYARFRLLNGDLGGASELAAKAAKAEPEGIDTLLVNGEVAVRHGDLNGALGIYDKTIKLYPTVIAALTGKAAVLGDLGRIDEMKPLLDKAAASAPRNPAVLFLRAKMAALGKDWRGVKAEIQPLEANLPLIDPLRQLYGEALLRTGSSELAIAQLQPIVRALPGNRDAVRLLAEAQLGSGDRAAAAVTLKPIADSPMARPDELTLMAAIAKANGDPAAAKYEARAHRPQVQALGRDLADADAAMRSGNWAGAAQAYDRILASTDGKNVMVLNNMAYAQLMLGASDKAIDYSQKALLLAPGNPSVMDTAGWALLKAGKDPQKAKGLLRRAAQQAPQNMTIRGHLAEAERIPG